MDNNDLLFALMKNKNNILDFISLWFKKENIENGTGLLNHIMMLSSKEDQKGMYVFKGQNTNFIVDFKHREMRLRERGKNDSIFKW